MLFSNSFTFSLWAGILIFINFALQCCVGFCCTAKGINYTYTYTHSFSDFLLIEFTTEHWVEFSVQYRKFSLVLYFMHSSVYMEKAMAPHSSTLAWIIPWTEEPGRLQSMGLLRVRHDWATSLSLFTFMHWRRKWQPTPVFLPGESQGRGSLVGYYLWGRPESDMIEAMAAEAAAVYICQSQSPNSSLICFVHLWLYFFFVSKFICATFLDSTYKQYRMILVFSWYYYLRMKRAQEPTPVFFPGGSHGQRNLAGKSKGSQRVGHNQSYLALIT